MSSKNLGNIPGLLLQHLNFTCTNLCHLAIFFPLQVRQSRGGKEVKTDLMVMENLLFGHNIARTYDLKGAVFSRYISDANEPEKVLLDQNFVEDMRISPMYIAGRNKHLFQRAIWNDTSFLTVSIHFDTLSRNGILMLGI